MVPQCYAQDRLPPPLTSRRNPVVARYRAVAQGQVDGLLLLDGPHLVADALAAGVEIEHAVANSTSSASMPARTRLSSSSATCRIRATWAPWFAPRRLLERQACSPPGFPPILSAGKRSAVPWAVRCDCRWIAWTPPRRRRPKPALTAAGSLRLRRGAGSLSSTSTSEELLPCSSAARARACPPS